MIPQDNPNPTISIETPPVDTLKTGLDILGIGHRKAGTVVVTPEPVADDAQIEGE